MARRSASAVGEQDEARTLTEAGARRRLPELMSAAVKRRGQVASTTVFIQSKSSVLIGRQWSQLPGRLVGRLRTARVVGDRHPVPQASRFEASLERVLYEAEVGVARHEHIWVGVAASPCAQGCRLSGPGSHADRCVRLRQKPGPHSPAGHGATSGCRRRAWTGGGGGPAPGVERRPSARAATGGRAALRRRRPRRTPRAAPGGSGERPHEAAGQVPVPVAVLGREPPGAHPQRPSRDRIAHPPRSPAAARAPRVASSPVGARRPRTPPDCSVCGSHTCSWRCFCTAGDPEQPRPSDGAGLGHLVHDAGRICRRCSDRVRAEAVPRPPATLTA